MLTVKHIAKPIQEIICSLYSLYMCVYVYFIYITGGKLMPTFKALVAECPPR